MIFISLILFPCLRSLKKRVCVIAVRWDVTFRKGSFVSFCFGKTLRRVLLGMSVECINCGWQRTVQTCTSLKLSWKSDFKDPK